MLDISLELVLIVAGWAIFLPIALTRVFNMVSRLGIYHQLEKDGGKETFIEKLLLTWETYVSLSLIFIISFYVLIISTIDSKMDFTTAYELSCIITLVTIVVARVISNPRKGCEPYLTQFYKREKVIKVYKNCILAFFYSFVVAAIILLLIMATSKIILGEYNLTSIEPTGIIKISIYYFIFLIIAVLLGELILFIVKPEDITPARK